MAHLSNYSSTSTPACLSFPCPRSPPKYPTDLSGKRRELAKVEKMEREIRLLQEELKSCEGLQPASGSCKEVDDFVVANPDPFIPVNQKTCPSHRFFKWLCGKSCFSFSWICCFSGCSLQLETLNCCCSCCPLGNWRWCCCQEASCSCCNCRCWSKISCRWCCTLPAAASCPDRPCSSKCTWHFPKCTKVFLCSDCTKSCCNPCCLSY